MRCEEIMRMSIDDVVDLGSYIHIKILESKTKKVRSFTIVDEISINILRNYISKRPKNFNERRFFIRYEKGKCCRSVMGIHQIGSVPKKVAAFLELDNKDEYTGHCLRRTAATLLVENCQKHQPHSNDTNEQVSPVEASVVNSDVSSALHGLNFQNAFINNCTFNINLIKK